MTDLELAGTKTAEWLVELSNVSKVYNRHPVIHDMSLNVHGKECIALIGKNGAGKSTLLRLLAGLSSPTTGQRRQAKKELSIGYVPERFPALRFTPLEYLRSVGRTRGMDKKVIDSTIAELMGLLGMDAFGEVRMVQFSKGMLQKVNLIQAVMGKPELLLLDEPLSGLDAPTQSHMVRFLMDIKTRETSIVMSVHEPQLIERVADRILLLGNGTIIREERDFRAERILYSSIVFSGISPNIREQLSGMPGFLRWESNAHEGEIIVSCIACDTAIRLILDSGGSIISVQQSEDIHLNLGEWLQPAAARG